MRKVFSSEELQPIEYYPQSDGTAVVYLRDNIEQDAKDNDDGTSFDFWKADEVEVVTDLAEGDIAESFETLWLEGEAQEYTRARGEMADAEWRADVDRAILDLVEVIA